MVFNTCLYINSYSQKLLVLERFFNTIILTLKFHLKYYQSPICLNKPTSVKKHQRKEFLPFVYTTVNKWLYVHGHLSHCLLLGVFFTHHMIVIQFVILYKLWHIDKMADQESKTSAQNWKESIKLRPQFYCFVEGEFFYIQ